MIISYLLKDLSFNIPEAGISFLAFEHEKLFQAFIYDLYKEINGLSKSFQVEMDNNTYEMSKTFRMIMSPFDCTFNDRNISKALQSYILRELRALDLDVKIVEDYASLIQDFEIFKLQSEFNIEFNDMANDIDILKKMDMHLKDPGGQFVERLTEYGTTISRLLQIKNLFVCNCAAYCNFADFRRIKKWAEYEQISVIFIENSVPFEKELGGGYIIDRDMCVIC